MLSDFKMEVLHVDLSTLKQGMVFKNYKDLCNFLNIKPTGGKVKEGVLNEIGRFAEFHKAGNKIVIDEVFAVPNVKIDKRKDPMKTSNNSLYSSDIQALIISLLANTDGHTVYLPVNRILRVLDMINCNYADARKNIPKLAEITKIPQDYCYEFFNTNNIQLKSKLETALNGLRRRALISYQECISICVLEANIDFNTVGDIKVNPINKRQGSIDFVRNHREATEEEVKIILNAEFRTLEEMDCISQQQVFLKGKWNEYQKKVNQKIFKEANIEYYYNSYRLIFNLNDVTKVHLRQLEEEERETITFNLNTNIDKMIKQRAKTIHNRARKKELLKANELLHYNKDYIKHMSKLSDVVIKKDAKDIRKELRKPVKEHQMKFDEIAKEMANLEG